MRIGELAQHAGATTGAVRFYKQRGLLPRPARTDAGYRDHSSDDVDRLRVLVGSRSSGIPLEEASALAHQCAAGRRDHVSRQLVRLVERQRVEVGKRQRALRDMDRNLGEFAARLVAREGPRLLISAR